jgi:hypothetical protein
MKSLRKSQLFVKDASYPEGGMYSYKGNLSTGTVYIVLLRATLIR